MGTAMSYTKQEKLGNGAFGEVWKCSTPAEKPFHSKHPTVAIKCISNVNENVTKEISILRAVKQQNILEYLDSFMSNGNMYIVTELCTGGELYDKIKSNTCLTDKEAASIIQQI